MTDKLPALVTGATGGIGQAIVARLIAGNRDVVACGQNPDKLAKLSESPRCSAVSLDISDGKAVSSAFANSPFDALIHMAAKLGRAAKLHDISDAEVRDLIELNVMGTLHLVRAVLPGMIARGRGHIILCGSVAGYHPGLSPTVYGMTKAAVASLAANLRYELLGTSIRVTEIIPGRVRTGMHNQLKPEHGLYDGYSCLEPEDVAAAVQFALDMPSNADVASIELMPTHQAVGGSAYHRTG